MQVAAGGALFHLVMDDDEDVSKLLGLLKKESKDGGRITCLPLNVLKVDKVKYTKEFGDDAVPLTKWLKFRAEHEVAIQYVRLCSATNDVKHQ